MKRHQEIIICLALVCLTFLVFLRVLWSDFTNFDDQHFVLDNPNVRAGLTLEGVKYAFTATRTANWHPLTWLSFMVDAQIYGTNPFGYHLTNLILHIINVALLFLLLTQMTGYLWRSAFVAALFGIHPLHVESVAWIAERKDVLSTLFWLLTMWAYVRYVRSLNATDGARITSWAWYLVGLVLFAIGLMAKPMLVTLPFVLLLLDYWPLGRMDLTAGISRQECEVSQWRFRRAMSLVVEKTPFFILSALSSLVTYITQQREGAMASSELYPLQICIGNSIVSYLTYLWKTLFPLNLAVFYPHPGASLPLWMPIVGIVVLGILTRWVLKEAKSRPYATVGWLWYLGTLVPVIGIVQVGSQALADRYTYVPLIGIFILVAWGIPEALECDMTRRRATGLAIAACTVLSALAILTWHQVGYWRNSITLFTHAIKAVPGNALAHNQLGKALEDLGKFKDAERHFAAAVRLNPVGADAHYNLGEILAKQGKFSEAIAEYRAALDLNPNHYAAHNNLGMALVELGRTREAIQHFREALRLNPNSSEARNNLANALARGGAFEKAIQSYRETTSKNPHDPVAHYNLGLLLLSKHKLDEAVQELSKAIEIKPDYADAHLNLGLAFAQQGDTQSAMEHFRRVLQIEPNNPEAHNNLGIAFATKGDMQSAENHFRMAIKTRPNYAEARYNLGNILAAQGKRNEAIEQYTKALQAKPDYPQAHFNLAVTLFYNGRYKEAWDEVHAAQRYGFKPDPGFLQALAARHPEPQP